jgi:integrase
LLKRLKINGRKRLGFYTLRHNFETVAGGSKDQVAVDSLMGHVDNSMAARYREEIGDDRLRAVVQHVRKWLFGTEGTEADQPTDE